LCCSINCLFCVVLCTVCVQMCTVILPPGGYPIAVKKYTISYHKNPLGRHGYKYENNIKFKIRVIFYKTIYYCTQLYRNSQYVSAENFQAIIRKIIMTLKLKNSCVKRNLHPRSNGTPLTDCLTLTRTLGNSWSLRRQHCMMQENAPSGFSEEGN
jgi:hypothetical protein